MIDDQQFRNSTGGGTRLMIGPARSEPTTPPMPAMDSSRPVKVAEAQSGDMLENAIQANVRLNVEKLKTASPVVSKLVEQGKVRVVGGIYRLATGHVDFFV